MLRQVYLAAGVLVDDPDCRRDPAWGAVRPGEAALTGQAGGHAAGAACRAPMRQRLAVERSQAVGLGDLYRRIEAEARAPSRREDIRALRAGRHPLPAAPAGAGRGGLQYAAGRGRH